MMKRTVKDALPQPLRSLLRRIYFLPAELRDRKNAGDHLLAPPRHLLFVGPGNFRAIGQEFMRHFRNLCQLQEDHQVLDIGCGVGRMAIPLTDFLSEKGLYEGFDIVPEAIHWCQKNVSPKYPNFRFQVANIYNKNYLPTGTIKGSEYRFVYPGETFDLAIATSLFTHLLPDDLVNYFREAARVLKTHGQCLFTFYLWNDEARELTEEGKARVEFPFEYGFYRSKDAKWKEEGIAYDEQYILDLLSSVGLELDQPVHYGAWCGRKKHLSHQDIVVVRKRRIECAKE